MLNKVILIGNMGSDPDVRAMPSGGKVASFSLATTDYWKDKKTGERMSKTEWHRITVFTEGLIGVIEKYTHKGSKIYIEGSISSKKYQDKEGVEKTSYEIVCREIKLLDSKNSSGNISNDSDSSSIINDNNSSQNDNIHEGDDEIPF